jgi:hypothetical protein
LALATTVGSVALPVVPAVVALSNGGPWEAAVVGGAAEWALAGVAGTSRVVLHPIATSAAAIPIDHILQNAPTIGSFSHAHAPARSRAHMLSQT